MDKYEELARRYGVSVGAVETLALALRASGGKLAQFNHPDLGGMGQWMPGMIMIGDMFNNALKAKVDALCTELAQFITSTNSGLGSATWPNFQAQRAWWPESLGTPASSGGQNDWHYAYFPASDRLAIEQNGQITLYDTTGYTITGVSQQQSAGRSLLVFSTPQGVLELATLKQV